MLGNHEGLARLLVRSSGGESELENCVELCTTNRIATLTSQTSTDTAACGTESNATIDDHRNIHSHFESCLA